MSSAFGKGKTIFEGPRVSRARLHGELLSICCLSHPKAPAWGRGEEGAHIRPAVTLFILWADTQVRPYINAGGSASHIEVFGEGFRGGRFYKNVLPGNSFLSSSCRHPFTRERWRSGSLSMRFGLARRSNVLALVWAMSFPTLLLSSRTGRFSETATISESGSR